MAERELIVSELVLVELARVLSHKLGVPEADIVRIETLLRQFPVEPVPQARPDIALSDEDDTWVLASAINAGADVFVTGDRDVLDASEQVTTIKIISPRQFWDIIHLDSIMQKRP